MEDEKAVMMLSEVVVELEELLKEGDFKKSIERMRSWLSTAEPGAPGRLLASCSAAMRPRVTLLMRDLLSRYPSTLLGCPLLLYATPELELDSPLPPGLTLPFPRPEAAKPCSDLHFIGWLPSNTELPVPLPFRPERYDSVVPWRTPTAAVALFRSHPGVLDLDALELPAMWWGELFRTVEGNVRLDGRLLMSYPDALDAAAALQAGARGEVGPTRGHFIEDINWAHNEGVVFYEACRSEFPS